MVLHRDTGLVFLGRWTGFSLELGLWFFFGTWMLVFLRNLDFGFSWILDYLKLVLFDYIKIETLFPFHIFSLL
jgi:hypothetical protein